MLGEPYHFAPSPTAAHVVPAQPTAVRASVPVGRFAHTPPERSIVRITVPSALRPTQVLAAGHASENTGLSSGNLTGGSHVLHGAGIDATLPFAPAAVHVNELSHAIV